MDARVDHQRGAARALPLARRLAVTIAGALLLMPAPAALAATDVDGVPTDPAEVAQLQARVEELSAEVSALTTERDRLREALGVLDELYDPMEADRLLLSELRKDMPPTRPEAEAYLTRLERLALASDPSRLGPIADRLLEQAPAFLDWRDTQFATTQEATTAFIESGANAFDTKLEEFRKAILLSVANRLDGLLNVVDRAR